MSGGVLVVVDRLGRPSRRFSLSHGLATLGRDLDNDIRIALPDIAPHHASIHIHDSQAVIRSTGGGVTLVNGRAVSVAALRHGDEISVGGRALRWEYSRPRAAPRPPRSPRSHSVMAELQPAAARARGARERRSAPGGGAPRDRSVQLALELAHRASVTGSTGGKQVAIVQPQRRDAGYLSDNNSPARGSPLTTRRSNHEPSTSVDTEDKSKRKSTARTSPKNFLQNTTKATLWIESRKTSPRRKLQTPPQVPPPRRSLPTKKHTPLRTTVLKKAQSAHKAKVIKIEAPSKIDHTKQVAIMLMTGHTPKSKLNFNNSSKKSPSYLVKKPSPVRKTPGRKNGKSARGSKSTGSDIGVTPTRSNLQNSANRRSSKRYTDQSVSILEISDSTQNSTRRTSRIKSGKSPKSPLPSPKKSAMKDCSKKSFRKTESIKFDLSNLENPRDSDLAGTDTTHYESDESENITLRYSESSAHSQSPSPRRPIHSRSGRMLEQVGSPLTPAPASPSRTLTQSPSARKSLRGSAMVQKVLETSAVSDRTRSDLSDRTRSDLSDRTRSDLSVNTLASDRTRSDISAMLASDANPRLSANSLASDRTRSRLSTNLIASDRTRSRLSANSIASDRTRSRLSANSIASDRTRSRLSANSVTSDRTRSGLSANTTALDRTRSRLSANESVASAFRTRTLSPRHNLESYSVVDLISFDSEDATKSVYDSADSTNASEFGTPAASARRTRSTINPGLLSSSTPYAVRNRATRSKSSSNSTKTERTSVSTRRSKSLTTPDNGQPVVVTKPPRPSRSRSRIHDDLSLLDSTEPDDSSPRTSKRSRTNVSETIDISNVDLADKTLIGMTTPENRHSPEAEGTPVLSIRSLLDSSRGSSSSRRSAAKGRKSERETVAAPARRSRLRLTQEPAASEDEGVVTPVSAAKPSPEAVKNKHSTAKKPQSKRSIIDDLNRSDIVKQLFDSPVKRKLTQSMSEYSRKRLFDGEEEGYIRNPRRATVAPAAIATNVSVGTKRQTSNLKYRKKVAENFGLTAAALDLSPSLNDVRLLYRTSPKNDLTDVRGIRRMFQKKSPANDLRNVSGVKRILRTSPKNDLTDVRGVRRMFKEEKRKASYQDVSGIEELYQSRDKSADGAEELFDAFVGRPPIKAVYSRTFTGRAARRPAVRRRSLQTSADVNNVEEWLEKELKRHLPAAEPSVSRRVTMELRKLATDTVEGVGPILGRRTRNSSFKSTSGVHNSSPGKRSPAPSRGHERGAARRAVHSTPLKGRLQKTMNASELGRVSPIPGPSHADYPQLDQDCFVSIPTNIDEDEKAVRTKTRSPRKQKHPVKIDISKPKEKTPEKSTSRATRRSRQISETAVVNTKRHRGSLVVTKKAPVMSPKADPKALNNSEKQSPKPGTSRIRARAAKASLIVARPSPKLIPRASKSADSSQTEVKPTKASEKKSDSKASPRGKRKTRADASKNEPQTKAKRTKIEKPELVEQSLQSKRTRRTNAKSNVGETSKNQSIQTRRGKAVTTTSVIEKKQPNIRGKKVQKQTAVESEIEEKTSNTRGKKVQSQTSVQSVAEGKKSTRRGIKVQTQTIAEPEVEVKKTNIRGKKVQTQTSVQTETMEKRSNTRGRKVQTQTIVEPEIEENRTNVRGRRAQPQTSIQTETEEKRSNTRGRKVQIQTIVKSEIEEKRTNVRGRRAQPQTIVQTETVKKQSNTRGKKVQTIVEPEIEEKRTKVRGRWAQLQTSIQTETVEKQSNTRGRKVQTQTIVEPEIEEKRTNVRGRKAQTQPNQPEIQEKRSNTRGKKVQFEINLSPRGRKTKRDDNEPRTSGNTESPASEQQPARSRRAKPEVPVVETRRGKRKATNDDLPTVIPPKRGKTEPPAKKSTPKPKGRSAEDKENRRQDTAKPVRGTRAKVVEAPVKVETTRARGRKAADPKEKVVESTRGKRKAIVDPSPAQAAKKAAPEPRARRATRAKPLPAVPTKAARGRVR